MKSTKHRDLLLLASSLLLVFSGLVFLEVDGLTGAVTTSISPGNIQSCGTLSSPGTYLLTTDVTSSDTCFTIGADNIVLDCQDNLITYGTADNSQSVYNPGYANIEVRNCNVKEH